MHVRLRFRTKRQRLLSLLFIIALVAGAVQSGWLEQFGKKAELTQPGLYSVKEVFDGDTISVDMNGATETVRFIGIDTPETHKPNTPVQCFAQAATAHTKQLIGTNHVRLQADPLNTNRDRYGRLLRYVYLPDGTLVNERIIQNGYGFAYTLFPFEKSQQFRAAERAARDNNRGLWAGCQVKVLSNGAQETNPAP